MLGCDGVFKVLVWLCCGVQRAIVRVFRGKRQCGAKTDLVCQFIKSYCLEVNVGFVCMSLYVLCGVLLNWFSVKAVVYSVIVKRSKLGTMTDRTPIS